VPGKLYLTLTVRGPVLNKWTCGLWHETSQPANKFGFGGNAEAAIEEAEEQMQILPTRSI
jgi:hypothetical protein